MSRQLSIPALASLFLGTFGFANETTEPSTAYWTGESDSSDNWSDTANWAGGITPLFDGTTYVYFPGAYFFESNEGYALYSGDFHVALDTSPYVAALYFEGGSDYTFGPDYSEIFSANLTVLDYVELGEGFYYGAPMVGAVSDPYYDYDYYTEVYFDPSVTIHADGTDWYVAYNGEIEIAGQLASSSLIAKYGDGMLLLSGDNSSSLSGEVLLVNGLLGLGQDTALGTATLTIGARDDVEYFYPALVAVDGDRSIGNNVTITNALEIYEDGFDEHELTFTGTVTLAGNTNIENYGGLLSFDGSIVEQTPGSHVAVTGDRPVIFAGDTGFTGGLDVDNGAVVFLGGAALPAAGDFTTTTTGYIGLIESSITDQLTSMAAFLSHFDPSNNYGTIGFDTDPSSMSVNSYAGDIDLTGFDPSLSIGSLTVAELTGTITPAGSNYRFGNGGGELRIGTALTDAAAPVTFGAIGGLTASAVGVSEPRGVEVFSTYNNPLTVYLNSSSNSFSGQVSVQDSALIFGNAPGTLPAAATLITYGGGYIGIQDTTVSVSDYLSQWSDGLIEGFIGFDSIDRETPRTITDTIDLTRFTAGNGYFLATSTNVKLTGDILLPGSADTYRFAGYKGGKLEVATSLTDGESPVSVHIGDSGIEATGYSASATQQSHSGVILSGNNSYSGGTYFANGGLMVTNDNALGTGTLHAVGNGWGITGALMERVYPKLNPEEFPLLIAGAENLNLANNIELSGNLVVKTPWETNDSNLTLSGDLSGSGALYKTDSGTLNLSGDNSTFWGGLYVAAGTVNINSDTAAGTGPIAFGGGYGQQVYFNSANPTIGGLLDVVDDDDYYMSSAFVSLASGTTLTIDPNGLELEFSGTISGDGSVVITGEGEQILSGYNTYTGGTSISNGADVFAGANSFGQPLSGKPAVNVAGARLYITDDSGDVTANVTFGPGGGTLGGNGRLVFDNTLSFGTDTKLAAGFSVGQLQLDGAVEFQSGGTLEVELGSSGSDVIADYVQVQSLAITSTAVDPFTLYLTNENGVVPFSFDPSSSYSWLILGATTEITNFDLALIDFQIDPNLQTFVGDGFFTLTFQNSPGFGLNESTLSSGLMVSFTPVPEPSTYALFGLGLTIVGWQVWRRRRHA